MVTLCVGVANSDVPGDRQLQPSRAVQRDDVLRVLPEEQLQELPDVMQSRAVLSHLLLLGAGSSCTGEIVRLASHGQLRRRVLAGQIAYYQGRLIQVHRK